MEKIKKHGLDAALLAGILFISWRLGRAYSIELSQGLTALLIIGAFLVKSVAIFIPALPLYLAAGILLPLPKAYGAVILGLLGNMSLGYLMGRIYGRSRVMPMLEKNRKIGRFIQEAKYNNNSLCFLMRVLLMPLDLTHMLFGALGLRYSRFITLSFLGLAPRVIPLVLFGGSETPEFILYYLSGLVISTFFFLVISLQSKKAENEKVAFFKKSPVR